MSDLAAFLRARLDEDEQMAREAADGDSGSWFVGCKWNVYRAEDETPDDDVEKNQLVVYGNVSSQSDHIARHDPERVLAEVDAKRRIVLMNASAADNIGPERAALALLTLWALAAVYRDHPDYRQEWAP
jgi:Family of unknown function (DUF6221)